MTNSEHPESENDPKEELSQTGGADDSLFDPSDIQVEPSDDDTGVFIPVKPVDPTASPSPLPFKPVSRTERRSGRMEDEIAARSVEGLPERMYFNENNEGRLWEIVGKCQHKITQAGPRALEEQLAQDLLVIISALFTIGGFADREVLRKALANRLAEYAKKVGREIAFDNGTFNAAYREIMPYCIVPGQAAAETETTAMTETTSGIETATHSLSPREIAAAKQKGALQDEETIRGERAKAAANAAKLLKNLPLPPDATPEQK